MTLGGKFGRKFGGTQTLRGPRVLVAIVAMALAAVTLTSCAGTEAVVASTELPKATTAPVLPERPTAVPRPTVDEGTFPEPRYPSIRIPLAPAHAEAGTVSGAAVGDNPLVLALGYSNTKQIMRRYEVNFDSDFTLVNSAFGGITIQAWGNRVAALERADDLLVTELEFGSIDEAQAAVEVILMQVALGGTGDPQVDFVRESINNFVDLAADRYPNLQQIYLIGREYGGWSERINDDGTVFAGEPGNWSTSIGIDLAVNDNLTRPDGVWVGPGPYLWANADTPRADGVSWPREKYVDDGQHLQRATADEIVGYIDEFFTDNPTAPWYSSTRRQ